MALSFVDTDGTLVIPQSNARWETAPSNAGIATNGVVVLVGEADQGPDFTAEADLTQNSFGPNQFAQVQAKYGAGRLVDAFRVLSNPSRDPGVRGAPSRIYLVKTNRSTTASLTLTGAGYTSVVLDAKLQGAVGNLIYVSNSVTGGVATTKIQRSYDGLNETFVYGGNIVLTAKSNSAATFAIDATSIVGGAGSGVSTFTATKSQFKTIGDIAAYMASFAGWTITVPAAYRQLPVTALDTISVADASVSWGAQVKKDAYEFVQAINSSRAVSVRAATAPVTGLPATRTATWLSGGTLGATTDSYVAAALDVSGILRANAVVTLFSQNADDDRAAGKTDNSSSYTISNVNQYLSDHVALFSQYKRKRPRQGYGSFRGTFTNSKAAAQTIANYRMSMSFQDIATVGATGTEWFQPWMGGVIAAGMQMAAFYKPIFNKALAVSGVRQSTTPTDFQQADDAAVEDALNAGLLVIRARDAGGFAFVSDQTTYSADQNFVYNSIQAIYTADTIAMTVAQRMEAAFVGQSFADVNSAVAMSYLKGIMVSLKNLKLIVASSDAVDGYKDAKIEIAPPSMLVSCEVKESTGVYFVPVRFLVTQTSSTVTG